MYNLSSLAHDSAAMALESHSRQTLGEDVCRLILTYDRIKPYLRLVYRSIFSDSMNANVGMATHFLTNLFVLTEQTLQSQRKHPFQAERPGHLKRDTLSEATVTIRTVVTFVTCLISRTEFLV